jgi:two-component system, cell cycle sensor histidine kinase and response regulator CckA
VAPDPFLAVVTDFEHLPVPGTVLDLDGAILAVNAAAVRLAARTADQLVGRKAWEIAPGMEHLWQELVAGAQLGPYIAGITIATPVGPRALRYVAVTRTVGDRTVMVLFGHGLDDTSPVDLRPVDSLALVAGGIAHDFNNQLVSVLAEASAAREDTTLPESLRETFRRIEGAAQRMSMLTRQLLAYAGRGRIVAEVLDPDELVTEMRDELRGVVRPDASLLFQLTGRGALIQADRTMLREALKNLVANASEALAKPGGKVAITTAVITVDSLNWWRIDVGDDGVGIEPHVLARVFDPFFTTKADRHGLGLSAVHGIIKRLGGETTIESASGRGTTVRVRLPVVSGAARPIRRQRTYSENRVSLRGLRVLVADDEPSVRATIRRLLERRGAHVVLAADGEEAKMLLAREPYALVLLDVMMPKVTGYQLLPIARRTQPTARIMLMSGYTDAAGGAGGEDEPDAFLEKPFTANEMDTAVDRLLGR